MKTVKRNDLGSTWNWTLLINNSPANLSGCTVTLNLKLSSTSTVSRTCTVVSPLLGTVSYSPIAGDVSNSGTFYYELVVTYPGGKTLTFPNDKNLALTVVPDLL